MTQSVSDKLERSARIFISSTFDDLQDERDQIVKFVAPKLRKLCAELDVALTIIDLRWGVDSEERAENGVLALCLAEIRKCRPFFVGILGERYGSSRASRAELTRVREFRSLRNAQDLSITHLEMLYGALLDPDAAEAAFFYLRDERSVQQLPAEQRARRIETATPQEIAALGQGRAQKAAADRRAALAKLKQEIVRRKPAHRWRSASELGDLIYFDLEQAIRRRFREEPRGQAGDAGAHMRYARQKARLFVGRKADLVQLSKDAAEGGRRWLYCGPSGVGKSTLLAAWTLQQAKASGRTLLSHFVGAAPHSADPAQIAFGLLQQLKRRFDFPEPAPTNPSVMNATLQEWLARTPGREHIVIVLDAIDQIDRSDENWIGWLASDPPPNVTLIASVADPEIVEKFKRLGWRRRDLAEMRDASERRDFVRLYLGDDARGLPPASLDRIACAPAAGNPLFLRSLLEELRVLGSPEQVQEHLPTYLAAPAVDDLLGMILARWARDYEGERPGLVEQTFALLAASRRGLSEDALLALLGDGDHPLPRRIWAPLLYAADAFLVELGGVLTFQHGAIRAAVERAFLADGRNLRQARLKLADFYKTMDIGQRGAELPWLQHTLQDWDALVRTLTDPALIEAAPDRARYVEWRGFWRDLGSRHDPAAAYEDAFTALRTTEPDKERVARIGRTMGELLYDMDCAPAALRLHRQSVDLLKTLEKPDRRALASALNSLAVVENTYGDMSAAIAHEQESLAILRQVLGPNHVDVANALQSLGTMYAENEQETHAISLMEEALAILGNSIGYLPTALRLNLGDLYRRVGEPGKSDAMLRQARAMCERDLGPEHPLSLACLERVANLRSDEGRHDEALTLYRQSLAINTRRFGDDSRSVALTLFNLGHALLESARFSEARQALERALAIVERLHGDQHKVVAACLTALNGVHRATHDFAAAAACEKRLAAMRGAHGDDAAKLAEELMEQGKTLLAMGDLEKARAPVIDSVALWRRLGAEYEGECAASLSLAGEVSRQAGDHDDARRLHAEALEMRQRRFGAHNLMVAESLNNLGCVLLDQERYDEAKPLLLRSIEIKELQLGEDHPLLADGFTNLAELQKGEEAIALHRRALAIRVKAFGRTHGAVAESLDHLGVALGRTGHWDEALPHLREALDTAIAVYGSQHQRVARVLHSLGCAYFFLSRRDEALEHLRRGVAMARASLGANHQLSEAIQRDLDACQRGS